MADKTEPYHGVGSSMDIPPSETAETISEYLAAAIQRVVDWFKKLFGILNQRWSFVTFMSSIGFQGIGARAAIGRIFASPPMHC